MLPPLCTLVASLAAPLLVCAAAAAPAARPKWDLRAAYRQSTAARTRISLNGLWRFQPTELSVDAEPEPPQSGWGFLKVPGTWGLHEWYGCHYRVHDGAMKAAAKWQDRPIQDYRCGWFEREFQTDRAWRGRRIALRFDGVYPRATVWLNGKRVGDVVPFGPPDVEVTDALAYDRPNRLQILVDGRGHGGPMRIGYGLVSNVWLCVEPKGLRLGPVRITTGVPGGTLSVTTAIHNASARQASVVVEALVRDGQRTAWKLAAQQARVPPGTATAGRLATTCKGAEAWSFESPKLYTLVVRLVSAAKVLDEKVERFGFRQFEIRGANFYLNGCKTHLRFESGWHDTTYHKIFDEPYIRRTFGLLKDLGYNGVALHAWWPNLPFEAPAVRIADEMGLMTVVRLPRLGCEPDDILEETPKFAAALGRIRRWIERYQNHPSVVMWRQVEPGKITGHWLDPRHLGVVDYPRTEDAQVRRAAALKLQDAIEATDPTRQVFLGHGNLGRFYSCNPYLIFTVPLQERAEWPALWARRRRAPFVAEEFGAAQPLALLNARDWDRARHKEIPSKDIESLLIEHAARYLGDDAYRLIRDGHPEFSKAAYKHLYCRVDGREERDGAKLSLQNEAFMRLCSLYAERTLRTWRTHGMSGIWLFGCADVTSYQNIVTHFGHRVEQRSYPDLTLPGAKLDAVYMPAFDALTPAAAALRKHYAPLAAYIGGHPNFASLDHAWFGGETIHKQAVFINDTLEPVRATGTCRLFRLDGKPLAERPVELTAQPGDIVRVPLGFPTPEVAERTDLRMRLELRVGQARELTDTFAVQLFPRRRAAVQGKLVVYDEIGLAELMLERAGVKATRLSPKADLRRFDVLVVGRGSLTKRLRRILCDTHFDEALRQRGLRVLVFEQTDKSIISEYLEERNSRVLFARDPSHPVLNGLSSADLSHWRGESDLVEAWSRERRPKRFYKGSNTNTVATFLLAKPESVAARAIVDGGFDLAKAGLVEIDEGAGRLLLCQLDVTARYGRDPVATRLVDNLLRYAAGAKPRRVAKAGYAGSDAGRGVLGGLGVDTETLRRDGDAPEADLLLVGADAPREAAARTLARGGTVVALGPEASMAIAEQFGLARHVHKTRAFKLDVPRSAAEWLRGIGPGDFYWKDWREVLVCRANGQDEVVSRVAAGGGTALLNFLDLEAFSGSRAYPKTRRVLSALLTSLGAPLRPQARLAAVRAAAAAEVRRDVERLADWDPPFATRPEMPKGVKMGVDKQTGHDGKASLRVDFDHTDANFHHGYVELPMEPDTTYEIGAWIKSEARDRMNRAGVQVDFFNPAGERDRVHILPPTYPWLCGTHGWTRLAGVFTTDADDTKVRIQLRRISGGGPVTGTLWFDDFFARKLYELPPVRLYPPPTRVSEYDPNTWRQW